MADAELAGPLATPEMLDALGLRGQPAQALVGNMSGGFGAGLGGDWPAFRTGPGEVAVVRVPEGPRLRRYCEIMGVAPVPVHGRMILGLGSGGGDDWGADHLPLMAEVARHILSQPESRAAVAIRQRLPRIAEIAASRLRAAAGPTPGAHLPPPDPARVEITSRHEAYGRYFSVEEIALRHRLDNGGWSGVLQRESFVSADAALLLPYDPATDRVLLISQFRVGPLVRGDRQCWMLEPVAGRIDVGETPQDAARREAVEEAGLTPGRLYELPPHYPTPGANCEYFYPFVATVSLDSYRPGGGFGLDAEGEDITTHILPRAELTRLALDGALQCGPLLLMALWLEQNADRIRADLA
ncbi:NUDIX domain-containing protein [Paracoccus sp. SCSIO 75233]|uniref:NUDIX domain-containing protein n=1 Tax=Paracoccus sp. SCSIO 75233 TaxID=3017782 RepID=UPI0022F09827|nr:NUDIX domain-containing protein [Paracoccus sp. SCSIO 75233]WBU53814.1 NUDIX domain-containing protein [Paracoccus sp. SCSIO 75233]